MNSLRAQQLVPAVSVFILASVISYISFTREPAGAFLFPRLIAVVMFVLAAWNLMRAGRGRSRVGSGFSITLFQRILPGVVVLLLFVFYAAKTLGFYISSFLTFFILFSLYDPHSHKQLSVWGKRLVISVCFMLVIYTLFSMLLQVQTPRGFYF